MFIYRTHKYYDNGNGNGNGNGDGDGDDVMLIA